MATEGAHDTSGYILHHLTNLKLDLHTMHIDPEATGFWVLHLDSMVFSVVLAAIFLLMFRLAARKATHGVPGAWQNFIVPFFSHTTWLGLGNPSPAPIQSLDCGRAIFLQIKRCLSPF